jgi:thymidylate synthase ThyX
MEQARGVLPQSLMTQYYATANLRNLVSFIKERSDTAAQSEIRCMAERMKGAVIKLFPISSEALLEEHCGGSRQYDVGYPLKEEDEHVRHNPNIHVELGKAI